MHLRQILINLLSNAVKFTDEGTIRIAVRRLKQGDGTHRLQFAITDSGIGISADQLPALFRPFVQLDGSATRRYGGTGLGLAISRRLAEALGGTIEAASEEGRGSTFTLSIDAASLSDGDPPDAPSLPAPR